MATVKQVILYVAQVVPLILFPIIFLNVLITFIGRNSIDTLLTHLIGHINPINGFRIAATLLSRRLCFWCSCASWSHQSMTSHSFLDLVIPTDVRLSSSPTSTDLRFKYSSRLSIHLHSNYMAELAQPLDINMLHNVYVQLTVGSDAEITTNTHWTEDFT